MGFDYWALGHVHKRQVHAQDPWVLMPGMPQGRDIGEDGAKSASLLTLSEGRIAVQTVPTSVLEFTATTLDISGIDSDDALRGALRSHMREIAEALSAQAGVVRLTLTGAPLRHWQILRDQDTWAETVAALARETGRLWLDKLRLEIVAPESSDNTAGATAELATLMLAIREEPGFVATAQAELDEVIGDLPPAMRAMLMPDEAASTSLAQTLAETGARRVLARMKGAEG
ncbi:putative metallophosphoesterase YhaO [Roseibaca ekhonensis]|uniref:Putative metallophosphoesterase YhaO n=1 Tax=Roseinatronobacter ekhonensis TaxID=254356 RepID=A0A3B0MD61_9RHOB|nr:hypothetical protein [Roseibaca ekhonensis]SUZ33752.1 putative metallophosphoesterase YhaO [Roseibaca ekhonensis]